MRPVVEIFRTNIQERSVANVTLALLHQRFENYSFNFDLEDCDKILRAETREIRVDDLGIITFLKTHGYKAELLPDLVPGIDSIHL